MSKKESHRRIKDYLHKQFNLPFDQIDGMIPSLINTLSDHMDNIEAAVDKGDLHILGRAGHTLKGALLNLGLSECAEVAYEIERKCRENDQQTDFGKMIQNLRCELTPYL